MRFSMMYKKMPQIYINAKDEFDAWKKLKKSGIVNKSKEFKLVRINNEYW